MKTISILISLLLVSQTVDAKKFRFFKKKKKAKAAKISVIPMSSKLALSSVLAPRFIRAEKKVATREVVVEMNSKLDEESKKSLLAKKYVYGVEKFSTYDKSEYFNRLYVVKIEDTKQSELELTKLSSVAKVEGIHKVELKDIAKSIIPSSSSKQITTDPLLVYQWGLINQGQVVLKDKTDIHSDRVESAENADIGMKSLIDSIESRMQKNVVVAVVDSGVDINHPDLKHAIFKNTEECDVNGQVIADGTEEDVSDNDGNSLHGDCMGWNFTASKASPYARKAVDDVGHGTHVAGIIAAASNNGIGISGISKKIKILPIKVIGSFDNAGGEIISMTDRLARGILYAVKMKVDVINLSLGWPKSIDTDYLKFAVSEAIKNDITIVAAAGNNNSKLTVYPCSYHHVICVGAMANDEKMAVFSNYGGNVDVLAPGDNILSLYPHTFMPLQFSMVGYEIKDGTSQAAPFVSAMTAVLKGVYDGISEDEVKGRLFESSNSVPVDKWNKDKRSLHGLSKLDKALDMEPQSSIKPIFKELTQIGYKEESKKFSFPLRVKNFWADSEDFKVHVEISSENFKLRQNTFPVKAMPSEKSLEIRILGEILDTSLDNSFDIKVTIEELGKTRSYYHSIPVVRLLSTTDDFTDKKIITENEEHVLGRIIDGRVLSNLGTITDHYKLENKTQYYLRKLVSGTVNDGIHFYLFNETDENIEEIDNSAFIKEATKIIAIKKIDLNYDGKNDFLIYTVNKDKKTDEEYLAFNFYDKNLSPLYGNKSVWRFNPDSGVPDFSRVSFIPYEFDGVTMAIPTFTFIGRMPKLDFVNDVWSPKPNPNINRVYYLYPTETEDGKVEVATRVIDNDTLMESIRSELQLVWNDNVAVINQLTQSREDFLAGISRVYMSVGKGFMRENFQVVIKSADDVSFMPLDYGTNRVEQNIVSSTTTLTNKVTAATGDTYIGYESSSLVKISHFEMGGDSKTKHKSSVNYKRKDFTDHIIGHLSTFKKDGDFYNFFQTKSKLLLVKANGDSFEEFEHPIARFSFLPGRVLNDLFFPIVANYKEELAPALYVDNTQISSNRVHVITANSDGIVIPIRYSVLVPNNCSPMNPVPMNDNGSYKLALFCKFNGNNWGFKYIDLN